MMAIVATFSLPAQALEKPEYSVLYEDGKFEYRLYQPYIVAETEMVGWMIPPKPRTRASGACLTISVEQTRQRVRCYDGACATV